MWTAYQIAQLQIGHGMTEGKITVFRKANTKTGKPVYNVSIANRGGKDAWSAEKAAKLANRFSKW